MTIYRAVSSLDVVELADDAILLRADTGSCRIEGASARLLAGEVLPRLSEWTPLEDLASGLTGYDPASLGSLLDSLVEVRLLVSRTTETSSASPAARILGDIGIDEGLANASLEKVRIGIVGRSSGAQAVRSMFRAGGIRRLHAIGAAATPDEASTPLSKQAILDAAGQLDLLMVCVDRAMLAARHWCNQAALATGCPAIFVDVAAVEAIVGPTVLPGESGCYTCFRMRNLATLDAFTEAMAHEHHLDARRDPDFERPAFPGLTETAAGLAVGEAFKLLFPPLLPSLVNAVLRVDPLNAAVERHEVLQQPECPHCRGIDTPVRPNRESC
jgi:bacteriocin biosynthesis cyclodehydratase domain-containing protein